MKSALLAFIILVSAVTDGFAGVTNLKAEHRQGQTFLTFTESADSASYDVYRSETAITSLSGLKPVARLDSFSGTNRYTNEGLVICDRCAPLAANVGLLVWTPARSGTAQYAVQVVGETSFVSVSVAETSQAVPGAVLLGTRVFSGRTVYEYMAWEDRATWRDAWGAYFHRFNVFIPQPDNGGPHKLNVFLHGAGSQGWSDPGWTSWPEDGAALNIRDNALGAGADPYAPEGYWYSMFFGRGDGTIVRSVTEQRIRRYVNLAMANPAFRIDPNRIYVNGASLGGGGTMTLARHMPDLFAAAAASLGWVDPFVYQYLKPDSGWPEYLNKPVDRSNGVRWNQWMDQVWLVKNATVPLPMRYVFSKNDTSVPPLRYPELFEALEAAKFPYAAGWNDGNHVQSSVLDTNTAWDWGRFRKNEAVPAFAKASNNDAYESALGQRNGFLDWGSSLHPLGEAMIDTQGTFAISLKSLRGDATADVTIRNAQQFQLTPGQSVSWQNVRQDSRALLQSGVTTADAKGLVTLRVEIKETGNRLTLQCSGCTTGAAPRAGSSRGL